MTLTTRKENKMENSRLLDGPYRDREDMYCFWVLCGDWSCFLKGIFPRFFARETVFLECEKEPTSFILWS